MIVGHGRWYFPFCYIDNLCLAVYRAMVTPGIEGRTYTVTNGQLITWREFFMEIYELLDRRQRVSVPVWAALAAAFLQQSVRAVFPRFTPSLNYYRIKRITSHTTYDISRTIRDLDYHPDQDARRQIRAIVDWYLEEKKNGFLP